MKNGDPVANDFLATVLINGGCSGTMLNNEWAIGCNHCHNFDADFNPLTINIQYDGTKTGGFKQSSRVLQIVRHPTNTAGINPYYRSPNCLNGYLQGFDIILYKLETPFVINGRSTGFKRKLWDKSSSELLENEITCVGWGMVSSTQNSDVLRSANVIVNHVERDGVFAGIPVGDRLHFQENARRQTTMPGDSGCGCFKLVNREDWYLVSINVASGMAISIAHKEVINWINGVINCGYNTIFDDTWEQFPNFVLTSPAVVSTTVNRLELFTFLGNNVLAQKTWNGASWTNWVNLGQPKWENNWINLITGKIFTQIEFQGSPSVTSQGNNKIDCICRGKDNNLLRQTWDGSSWSGYNEIESNGKIFSSPAAYWLRGELGVFVLGRDLQVIHKKLGPKSTVWEDLGGEWQDAPTSIVVDNKEVYCFCRGLDSRLYYKKWDGLSWSTTWLGLDGLINSSPSACSWGGNRIDVFARGFNNQLVHIHWNGTKWSNWEDLGGYTFNNPAVVSWGHGRIDCFIRSLMGEIHHKWTK